MKYLLCIPHTLYVQWVCWFGGEVIGKKIYLLCPIRMRSGVSATIKNNTFVGVRHLQHAFIAPKKNCKLLFNRDEKFIGFQSHIKKEM